MPPRSAVLSEPYAGLVAQACGLAEAAGLTPALVELRPRGLFARLPAALWPAPLATVGLAAESLPNLLVGVGGKAARVVAALRRPGRQLVQVQHPRMDPRRFDLVVVNRHDELTGPNVLVTRTALHRVTPELLAAARAEWAERLAILPRPRVAVLIGGSNGRFRLDVAVAQALAAQLAALIRRDHVGVMLTPSRRTAPAVRRVFEDALRPLGAHVWDMTGPNPYFGMLAWADAVIATMDSVSMVSEAAATSAPVYVARLPGRSRRISLFLDGLVADGRIRWFEGACEAWPAAPLNDTLEAAAELRRRLGF